MKLVDQQEIDLNGRGDCMRACLASLLELPMEEVPHLRAIQMDTGTWFGAFTTFLKKHGYEFQGTFYFNPYRPDGQWSELAKRSLGVDGFFMAGGPSPRGAVGGHAVIIDSLGQIVHDPHPSRAGCEIKDVYMIERGI